MGSHGCGSPSQGDPVSLLRHMGLPATPQAKPTTDCVDGQNLNLNCNGYLSISVLCDVFRYKDCHADESAWNEPLSSMKAPWQHRACSGSRSSCARTFSPVKTSSSTLLPLPSPSNSRNPSCHSHSCPALSTLTISPHCDPYCGCHHLCKRNCCLHCC